MIDVLQRLAGNPKITALATGGYLNVLNNGFTGPACISLLEPLLFSKAFLGTCGVDLGTSAVLATTTDDGKVDDQVLKNASYRFLLADHEKFSIHSGYRWASISDFTAVITDSTDSNVLRAIAATGTPRALLESYPKEASQRRLTPLGTLNAYMCPSPYRPSSLRP